MKFSEVVKFNKPDLAISARHDAWLEQNPNPEYSPEAINFMLSQIGKPDRVRRGTFSASSVGGCLRKQQFTFLGLPQIDPSPRTSNIFHTGTAMHLRWQMAGLTEGWLVEAEIPVPENSIRISGTMDGIDYKGRIVELKSAHHDNYMRVMSFGPLKGHLAQMAGYMIATGRDEGAFLYEDKNTQDYVEIPVTRGEVPIYETEERIERLWDSVERKDLYEPLSQCLEKTGMAYKLCPYAKQCLDILEWEQAEEIAG